MTVERKKYLKRLAMSSLHYSAMDPGAKRAALARWQARWDGVDHEHYPRWLRLAAEQDAPDQGKNQAHDHGVDSVESAGPGGSVRSVRAPTGAWCGDPFAAEMPPAVEPRRRKGKR